MPTTALLIITNTIGSLQAFVPFFVMTNGGPGGDRPNDRVLHLQLFTNRTGVASAGATLFLMLVLAITAVQLKVTRRPSRTIY